jgi:hypothetical protein
MACFDNDLQTKGSNIIEHARVSYIFLATKCYYYEQIKDRRGM